MEGREAEPGGGGDLMPRSSCTRRLRSSRTRLRQRCFSRSFHPDPDPDEEEEDDEDAEELPDVLLAAVAVVLPVGEKKASTLALGPGLVRPPLLLSILRRAATVATTTMAAYGRRWRVRKSTAAAWVCVARLWKSSTLSSSKSAVTPDIILCSSNLPISIEKQ